MMSKKPIFKKQFKSITKLIYKWKFIYRQNFNLFGIQLILNLPYIMWTCLVWPKDKRSITVTHQERNFSVWYWIQNNNIQTIHLIYFWLLLFTLCTCLKPRLEISFSNAAFAFLWVNLIDCDLNTQHSIAMRLEKAIRNFKIIFSQGTKLKI